MWHTANPMKIGVILAKLAAAGMLLWALAGDPIPHAAHSAGHRHTAHASGHGYDYYVLLRWVVCGVGALGAFRAVGIRQEGLGLGAGHRRPLLQSDHPRSPNARYVGIH